jgi:DNA-binding NtrC family response regulator
MQAHTTIIRRILVVCSDPATRRVIEDATRAWMFETVACSLLRDAEDLLARQEFALVFCEDRFEDGGYRDLLSVVAPSHKVPVVVMISDVGEDSIFRDAVALGAFGVVPNPCSTKDVQWMVIRATQGGTSSPRSILSARRASAPASNGLPQRK